MCNNSGHDSNASKSSKNESLQHSGMGTHSAKRNYSSSGMASHQRTTSSTPSKPAQK